MWNSPAFVEKRNIRANPSIVYEQPGWHNPAERDRETGGIPVRHYRRVCAEGRSRGERTNVLLILEKYTNTRPEPTGIEPSVAPHAPSVTAHRLQACCSRCKHLQTQALLPEAAPIQHLSLLAPHTHNVVLGLIHRVEVFPPKTGPMCCAASNKASPSAR